MGELRAFIGHALREATRGVVDLPRQVVGTHPGDRNQVVTAADLRVNAALTELIRARFPASAIVSEEADPVEGDGLTWIIDPIDGTSNFAAGSPLYGSMVAAVRDGEVVAGGIALPAFDELYTAALGEGAFLGDQRLRLTPVSSLVDELVAYGVDVGSPSDIAPDLALLTGLAGSCRGIRSSNSVFDAVMVARGAYGALLHRSMRIWDIAPIAVLVTEAGGECTDLDGSPLRFDSPTTRHNDVYAVRCARPGLSGVLDTIVGEAR
ncbi:inositol monophosphatase family protein [Actinokineospora diospyrosa]|uniref:Myo-inositol-1(Or 4)-monophosphatase n=1 Tax=Actinokineospora diospyrosa TaxID=103728 RepID=A0ABT1IMM1_9PSEU|nr:inositol monophosphatase [Actinokineospora diospyrosa]MCP2273890.1 myo-inositol-1(or 4)-monophosphatase [Actinokineospora diospyrosa]